jgi:sulfite reductase alpha subunit-like flavoprotein
VLDATTLLQLGPPKYRLTYLPAAPAGKQVAEQQPHCTPGQQEEELIEQAVAAAAAFRAVAAEAAGAAGGSASSSSSHGDASGKDGSCHGPWRPFMAPLLVNQRVTAADHFQETRHLEFDLAGSGLSYEPGDLLAVFPRTPAADVEVRAVCCTGCVAPSSADRLAEDSTCP